MLIEDKSDLKQFFLVGMLIGLIAGSAFGFFESILIIFTGFNVPFIYVPLIYNFDLLTCSVIGVFCGLAFGTICRFQANLEKSFNIKFLLVLLVLTGILLYQNLALILFDRIHLGLKIIISLQFTTIILFYYLYIFFKKESSKENLLSTTTLVSTIILFEIFFVFSSFLNTEYFHGIFNLKSILINIAITFLLIIILIIIEKTVSRFEVKEEHPVNCLTKYAVAILLAGLFVSIAVWFPVQPRFIETKKTYKSPITISHSKTEKTNPNIILIGIDTLRADHLGSYGYSRQTSPHIDKLAREGVTFKIAISQAPWTLPSFASIMTSLYPSQHGVFNRSSRIDRKTLTLPEVLEKESYITGAFTGGGWLSTTFGFYRGFQTFDSYSEHNFLFVYKPLPYIIRFPGFRDKISFSFSIPKIIDWLKANAGKEKSFFLFIHTYDVHNYFINDVKLKPYLKKLGVQYDERVYNLLGRDKWSVNNLIKRILNADTAELSYIRALYDASIMFTDELLGKIFDALRSLGIDNNTLIILTSDHGEGFNRELKRVHHGGRLHQDLLHVPLIFKFSEKFPANKIINEQVQLIDILPTICDLLNIEKSPQFKGESLKKLIYGNGGKKVGPAFSEELAFKFNRDNIRVRAQAPYRMVSVIFDGKKFIHSPDRDEFYNFKSDPAESINLVNTNSPYENMLNNELKSFIAANKPKYSIRKVTKGKNKRKLKEIRKKLKSLGYLK